MIILLKTAAFPSRLNTNSVTGMMGLPMQEGNIPTENCYNGMYWGPHITGNIKTLCNPFKNILCTSGPPYKFVHNKIRNLVPAASHQLT